MSQALGRLVLGAAAWIAAIASISAMPVLAPGRVVRLPNVPPDVIVGRARCAGSTWILTDRADLILIETTNGGATVRRVTGLAADDRPWGLACLDDGTLWTLGNPRALVRVTADGRTHERVALPLPRVAVYGVGSRVLFQQIPVAPATPALLTSPPSTPSVVTSWRGLVQQAAASREREVEQNLVTCGLGLGGLVPCWFIEDTQIVVSDGRTARTIDVSRFAFGRPARMRIHDAALSDHAVWVLLQGQDDERGRLAGTTLIFNDPRNEVRGSLLLKPAARVLVAATDSSCLVLTVDGTLSEIKVTS